jgi:hypothetical protein
MCDQAAVDRDDVGGAVRQQAPAFPSGVADHRTRVRQPRTVLVARDRLDDHVAVDARQPVQLLADDLGL